MTTDRTQVRIEFVEFYLEKPPMVRLFFDLWLANDEDTSCWFMLPVQVGEQQGDALWRVDALSVVRLDAPDAPLVGRFEGERGFSALLLGPHSRALLHDYPILTWGEIPDSVTVEVFAVPQLTVWERPAAAWFGRDPTWPAGIEVNVETLAEDRRVCATRRAPEAANRDVAPQRARRTRVSLSV